LIIELINKKGVCLLYPKNQLIFKMKLAEALILRADCQKRIEQLRERLSRNAKVQEGEKPAEKPEDILAELDRTLNQLNDLIKRINKTNSSTAFKEGMTLADALAERDVMILKHKILSELAKEASSRRDIFTRSEVKYFSTINVSDMQNQADEISKKCRELDSEIQEKNWNVELI